MKSFVVLLTLFTSMAQAQLPDSFILQPKRFWFQTLMTGTYLESSQGPFKGCVLYLEGFGDSIRNHVPLFKALSDNGYRVVTFDYYGQGGSSGSMDATKLSSLLPAFTIGSQAKWAWQSAVKNPDRVFGRTCAKSPKLVVGWSTGGLATYKLAYENWADAVVLIAPGIHVETFVGESAQDRSVKTLFNSVTERTLTSQRYGPGIQNPHIDPPKPNAPFETPAFAANLLLTSYRSQGWKIPVRVKGLVFLSGPNDTYVDSDKVSATVAKNARHFKRVRVPQALHEIDNEIAPLATGLQSRTIDFFDSITIPLLLAP